MNKEKGTTMRDMVFKNLTSADKKKRILWASETITENGLLTRIHKYLIYIVKEVDKKEVRHSQRPAIHVLRCRDTHEKTEKFHIRMKGGVYCITKEKCFFINFCHTLKIDLCQDPHPTHL